MAATNVGSIYYTVEAETDQLLSANKAVDSSIDKTSNSFKKLDTQVTKTATAVKSSIGGVGRSAGQAGIQLQQFIGQIQGGQGAMLALSQQSADLGFVLGMPLLGAVVGIAASLAGMLIPNLMKTTTSLEDVEKATERVKAAVTLSSEGITGYSDAMKVLAGVSDKLARVKLANIIADQANAMKVAVVGVKDSFDEVFDKSWTTYGGNVEKLFGNTSYLAYKAAADLKAVSGAFSSGVDDTKINDLADALKEADQAGINTTESGRKMVSVMTDLIAQYKLGELTISQLKEQLDKTSLSFDDQGDSAEELKSKYNNLIVSLGVQADTLGMSKSKLLKYNKELAVNQARLDKQDDGVIRSIETSYDRQIAYAQEIEKSQALAKAKRDEAKAEKESQAASKNFIKNFGIDGEDEAMDPNNPDSMATGISRSIIKENKTLLDELDRQRGMITLYQDLEIGDAQTHADALKIIDDQITAEKEKSIQEQARTQQAAMQAQLGIYNQLFSGMQDMTSNVLASMDEQSDGYRVMFAIQKAFAVAQAIVAAESAAAQVLAHDAGIMGMGAVATSNIIRGIGYASAGVIAGTAISGGRQYGGPVSSNGMYRINENGAPEVFNAANGQQYMLPNTRGEVVSNKDSTGGGSVNIIVNVNSDGSVSTNGSGQMAQFWKEIGQMVEAKYKQMESQSMRQGGSLWRSQQKGK